MVDNKFYIQLFLFFIQFIKDKEEQIIFDFELNLNNRLYVIKSQEIWIKMKKFNRSIEII